MLRTEFEEIYKNALIEGLTYIKLFIEDKNNTGYWWDVKKYKEYPRISFFDSGLPSFYNSSSDKIDYSDILERDSKCESFESWKTYYEFVNSDEKFKEYYGKRFFENSNSSTDTWRKIFTYYRLSSFVDRYIHLNKENIEFNSELFSNLIDKWFSAINGTKLSIEIYIPILLAKFDFDEIKIADNIHIRKMDKLMQLSRHEKVSYTDSSKNAVAGAATHAIVLENWTIDNSNFLSVEEGLNDINSYNSIIEIVEDFFSVLRVATGINSGYSQIVTKAIGWEEKTKGDLYYVYVVSKRKYPDFFDNYGWLIDPPVVKKEDILKTADFYLKVRATNNKRIQLALTRLNTSFLRSREEDTILDITIAFETILTHDSQSEITYRLSSRVASLCMLKQFKDYSQFQVFEFCKKIYSYRSAIVHGEAKRIVSKRKIKVHEDKEIETIVLSLELLRHILGILIEKPEFNDPIEIDKLKISTEPNIC